MATLEAYSKNTYVCDSPLPIGGLRDRSESPTEVDDLKMTENGKQEHLIEEFLATAPPEDEDITVKRIEEKIQKLHHEFSSDTSRSTATKMAILSNEDGAFTSSMDFRFSHSTPEKKRKHVI